MDRVMVVAANAEAALHKLALCFYGNEGTHKFRYASNR